MVDEKVKKQLHQSHLALLYRCGEKFRRSVIENEKEPSTTPLVIGSATHFTNARNLQNKIDKGSLLPREAIQDYCRDDFNQQWEGSSIMLTDDELSKGLIRTRDTAQDVTIRLILAYHYDIANQINPKRVERKWVLKAPDHDFDISGTMDVDEGDIIRDTKTMKINGGQRIVDLSEQYTFYSMGKYYIDKILPKYVYQDNLIKPTEKREAYGVSYRSTRTLEDFKIALSRFSMACSVIKKGSFVPANPVDPLCSPKFCGFYNTCKYVNGVKVARLMTTGKEVKKAKEGAGSIIDSLTKTLKPEA